MKNSKNQMTNASSKTMSAKAVKVSAPTYEQKVTVINQYRRRGDVMNTANRTNFAPSTVSEVFSGRYKNVTIVNAAYKVANARKTASNRVSRKTTKSVA